MDFYEYFHKKINLLLQNLLNEKEIKDDINKINFTVESPKNSDHGDISTNIAMVCAKYFSTNPMILAEEFSKKISDFEEVKNVSFVKPGFINIILHDSFWQNSLKDILKLEKNYAKNSEKDISINIEYVSANPTGPLHIGHGRGAVVGDILANVFIYLGYKVTKEYYINDAGAQINTLVNSFYFRYMECLNKDIEQPNKDNFYPGEYLIESAKKLASKDGDKWIDISKSENTRFLKQFILNDMLNLIKKDLELINVKHDVFVSEAEVSSEKEYKRVIDKLTNIDLIYKGILNPPKGKQIEDFEPREQLLFKSSSFGDDTDRPLEKSSGERTYFANDMVYHNYKVERGFNKMILVLGADHIGYVKRISALVSAMSNYKSSLNAICCQLVSILNNGQVFKMSKRAGTFVTISDVVDVIGKDAFRFLMITRKNDVSLDIDIAKIKEQNADNPVFYIQYSYARACSVLRNYGFEKTIENKLDFSLLNSKEELNLIKNLLQLPKCLKVTLANNDPHKIYLYLMDIARSFHVLWNKGKEDSNMKFIIDNNQILTLSRLSLVHAFKIIMENLFDILGIDNVENM